MVFLHSVSEGNLHVKTYALSLPQFDLDRKISRGLKPTIGTLVLPCYLTSVLGADLREYVLTFVHSDYT